KDVAYSYDDLIKKCNEYDGVIAASWDKFDKNFFDAWVTGFVGGANWISKKSIHADETIFGIALLKFCKSNPSENVFTGVMQVYKDFN
ncbi:MAG: hypothetical protein EBW86_11590, partial [Rhodobacteraceae bacterium]|nr:hypothetical protein [Paracoccaceae bacterium]